MSKRKSYFTILLGALVVGGLISLAMPIQGETFPDLKLNAPITRQGGKSLGIPPDMDSFRLSDIDADYVLIEAVNTMCGHCRESASNVNTLFKSLSQQVSPERLKVFALFFHDGEGSVSRAKRYFPGDHPKIADPFGSLAQAGKVVVPTLYAIKLSKNGEPHSLVYKHLGRLDDPEAVKWSVLFHMGSSRLDALWSYAATYFNS